MSGDPGYPDDIHQYDNDPRSPFYNDITESAEFESAKDDLYRERIKDINGHFIESLTESTDEWLQELSNLVLLWGDVSSDKTKDVELEIGRLVARRVDEYCEPIDDEVIDAMVDGEH